MRKHFLLLFLMAILPLAGWAEGDPINLANAVVSLNRTSLDYIGTGSNVPAIQSVTIGNTDVSNTYYGVTYKKVTATTPTVVTEDIAVGNIKNAGSYQMVLTVNEAGAAAGYAGSKIVPFSITKRHLIMTLNEQAATKVYGEQDPTTLDYHWTNASEIQYPDNVNNLELNWNLEREEGEDVDTYNYTTAEVTATNYDIEIVGAATATLAITPATLTVTYLGELKKVYGENNPTLPKLNDKVSSDYVYTITGFKRDDTREALFANQAVTYTVEDQDANYTPTWTVIDGENRNYITVTEITNKNYEISFVDIELKIAQAKFNFTNEDGYSFALYQTETTQEQVYDAKSLAPSLQLKYTTSDENKIDVVTTGDDPEIYLTYATEDGDEAHKTVGTYTVTVNAADGGNYAGALAQTITFKINKRTIYSFIDVDNKVYDKTAIDDDDVEISLSNVAQNDKTGDNAITPALFEFKYNEGVGLGVTPYMAVATYEIEPKLKAGIAEATAIKLTKNYTIEPSAAQFDITARPVMITAVPQTIAYGGTIKQTSADPVFNAYTIGEVEGEDVSGLVEGDALGADIAVELAEAVDYPVQAAAYEGVILVKVTTPNENYDIRKTPGDLTVTGASFTLIAKPVTVTYDGTTGYTTKFGFTTSGINKSLIDANKVSYKVLNYAETEELEEYPTDANVYKIIPVLAPEDVPANYSTPSIIAGDLTINQLALTINAGVIEINNGATPDDLNALGAGKVLFKDAYENEYEIPYTLSFREGITDTDGNLHVVAAGDIPNGYEISAKEGEDYSNYLITWAGAAGTLRVFTDVITLDRTADDLLAKLAAADGNPYTVKFKNNRKLRAGQWNMMVLPFDTDVATVSAAMKARKSTWTQENPVYETGYAIVNVLDDETTSSNIRFQLHMGALPANHPFLIKTSKEVELDDVEFAGVAIDDPEGEEVTGDVFNGVSFMGLYTNKADLSNTERTIKTDNWYTNRKNANLKPFEAYLAGCEVAARVFIEDFENGTTAIKELNAETGKAYNVDGWYTVNGIKLESMPTEKGVYINNGKKIVIK
jgi:hypothetical protein